MNAVRPGRPCVEDLAARGRHDAGLGGRGRVHAAVRATFMQAGFRVEHFVSTGRKDHVKLCLRDRPTAMTFWQRLFTTRAATAERLRGCPFQAVAYVQALAEDTGFWRSLASSPAGPGP